MSKLAKRYYAIKYRGGATRLLFKSWDEVEPKVRGTKGTVFKGFNSEREAREWLDKKTVFFRDVKTPFVEGDTYIFTDGSCSTKKNMIGWGWVAVKDNEPLYERFGGFCHFKGSGRNVAGEIYAARDAVIWAAGHNPSLHFHLVHDYAGVSNWALGYWKAKREIAQDYIRQVQPFLELITFEKINGHSGIKWNDRADELAKLGLEVKT